MSRFFQSQPMIRLTNALSAWGTPGFADILKKEIEQLDAAQLPLQQGLTTGSYVTDTPFSVMIISFNEDAGFIQASAGIFYSGIIAGCSCADDPTPVEEQNEYCEVRFAIDKATAETTVSLLVRDEGNRG